ncbi:hypothetical protein [Oscillatoria sp. HE19RPO]|uniref:hypothetical protein n=1 Tax=Oscillatoria sp. HE19RPO TaxID=2954806 RepID=UPI0020C43DA3|nr:hypothetical protein [Oscillatoria sp. HE19RPO]
MALESNRKKRENNTENLKEESKPGENSYRRRLDGRGLKPEAVQPVRKAISIPLGGR